MIIKNQPKRTRDVQKSKRGIFVALLCCFLLLVLSGLYWKGYLINADTTIIKTSFERKSGESFREGFSGSNFQTGELAKTGKYSILVDSDSSKQTAHIEINNRGHLYGKASVWAKVERGNPIPIINIYGNKENTFHRTSTPKTEKKNDWQLIELSFVSPGKEIADKLILNLEVQGEGEIYFDDFEVEMGASYVPASPNDFLAEKINLRIEQEDFKTLKKVRDEAVGNGVLISQDEDWVSAQVIDSTSTLGAKIRLKGDWVDHLKGDKWSFRVKFKKDDTWRRMKTISFQSPEARSFLHEWILHKFWEREDVLTTRYDFVTLDINGQSRGIYAYEEHFEKQLLEYKSRREGPIVRFDESSLWEERSRALKLFKNYVPRGLEKGEIQFETAQISPFGEGKIQKSEVLTRHMKEAQNLMHQYQKRLKKADEIFDLNQVAKYYAICDVMDAHHATIWHNERFYYNPVINKLEAIGYDGNVGLVNIYATFKGEHSFHDPKEDRHPDVFSNLARDTAFVSKYIHYLNVYSQKSFIDDFIKEIKPGARARETFLKREFEKAIFNTFAIRDKAKRIQAKIWPYNENSLNAYTKEKKGGTKILSLKNRHSIPLEILGTGISKNKMDYEFEKPEVIWAYNSGMSTARYKQLEVPINAKYIYCKALGLDAVVYSTINPLNSPEDKSSSQEIFSNIQLDTSGIYIVKDKHIFFRKGKQTIDRNIVIPAGYIVVFDAGVELDFVNQSAFISYSPVKMYGLDTNPIRITSSDKSAKGFTVLQAKTKSTVNHTVFSHFDTWSYKNWILTGAVTFYESDVEVNSSLITSNTCEDALNIIRSEFTINDLTISNTFGDGLDADFCKGEISDSRFINTGNDGMDFSGSNIHVDRCKIKGAGDKGLSGGEESHMYIKNFMVEDAVLGVASKDLSVLHITDISLKDCKQGFAAFRKKPEYGKGTIYVGGYEAVNVDLLYNIEKGSILKLDDKFITE